MMEDQDTWPARLHSLSDTAGALAGRQMQPVAEGR
jgi:hypothetical protein